MTTSQRKPRIGDVVVVRAADGEAYARYTHQHPQFGALVSVLELPPTAPPRGLSEASVQFRTFFPLDAACRRGIAEILLAGEVPEAERAFPTFRAAMRDPAAGRVARWWLWDGEREWPIEGLTLAQARLPIREVLNDALLVERARAGWRPESEQ